jgi:hypothetical protein
MTTIRRPGAASAAVLIALSTTLVTAHAVAPEWARRTGLDVWNYAALQEQYRTAVEEQAEVEAYGERAASRREAGNQIAGELILGTTSLPKAADELMEIFRHDSGTRVTLETLHYTAPTERHRFARHAIDRVRSILCDEPERLAPVLARLEAEYRAMCAPESPKLP